MFFIFIFFIKNFIVIYSDINFIFIVNSFGIIGIGFSNYII